MEFKELGYWHTYEVEILVGPSDKPVDYIFCEATTSHRPGDLILELPSSSKDWLQLKITPAGLKSWTGRFQPGSEGISALYATPSESNLCVVLKGQGYWISVFSPKDYQIIPSYPIREVLAVPSTQLMVFVDYDRLSAYGENGLMWKTPSLSWDGLKILETTHSVIKGTGWDAPNKREVEFCVTVKDGTCIGGSSPADYALTPK